MRISISIIAYAGSAGVVLEPTPGSEKVRIMRAIDAFQAGGSTAGGEGIDLAYRLAEENFDDEAVNRVILATDGDFNVGISDPDRLEDFIAGERESGVYLSILGFGRGNLNDHPDAKARPGRQWQCQLYRQPDGSEESCWSMKWARRCFRSPMT